MNFNFKFLLPAALVVMLVIGLGAGMRLVSKPQKLESEAASPSGTATFKLEPSSSNVNVGDNFTLTGKLNTGSANVLSYQIIAYFTYTTATPPIEFVGTTVTSIEAAFSCQFNQINLDSAVKKYTFAVSCNTPATTPPTTFSTNGAEVSVFTVDLHALADGSLNYVYDESLSKVNDSSVNATDILATPAGGSYIAGTVADNPTPTPTGIDTGPTPTPTSVPGEPNACGGTCGSNANCQAGLMCSGGHCRNPSCTTSSNCVCSLPTPTPVKRSTPTPVGQLTNPTPTASVSNPFLGGQPQYQIPEVSVPPLYVEPTPAPKSTNFFIRIINSITDFFTDLFGR